MGRFNWEMMIAVSHTVTFGSAPLCEKKKKENMFINRLSFSLLCFFFFPKSDDDDTSR